MVSLMLIFGVATGVFLLIALGSRSTKKRGAWGDGDRDVPWVHGSGGAEFVDSSGCSDGSSDGGGCSDGSSGADGGGCGDGGGGGGGE
jgi:hypothetical protein